MKIEALLRNEAPRSSFEVAHPVVLSYLVGNKPTNLGLTSAEAAQLVADLTAVLELDAERKAAGIAIITEDGVRYRVRGGVKLERWVEPNPALRRAGHWRAL